MRYEPVRRLTKDQLHSNLENHDPEVVAEALHSAARFDDDRQWVQDVRLEKMKSSHAQVRWAAATCLGDMACWRCHLDLERVIPALELATQDAEIAGPATLSLSMVRRFLENK